MDGISEISKQIASVEVKVGGEKQRLILTENYVSIHCKKWFFREDTSFIPLNSIDSIFFGWKRYWLILAIGVFLFLGGLVEHQNAAIVVSAAFIVIFWFYQPHMLLVRSSKESLGGNPISGEEARKFISVITDLLNKRN